MNKSKTPIKKTERRLWVAFFLTGGFTVIEIIAGWLTGSLALISDAAHMSTDAAALIIALLAIQISKRKADSKRTFGYYRFEIFAAIINASLLFILAFYIFYQAYQRWFYPHSIATFSMLMVALIGLFINLINIKLLHEDSKKNLNVRGAFLEAFADLIASLGVIIAAILIYFTGLLWIDSFIAILIGLWVLPRSWLLLKESINILLEGVPEGLTLAEINESLLNIPGVCEIHDLHVWALSSGKVSLTAHLVVQKTTNGQQSVQETGILKMATDLLEKKFNITHVTLQVEPEHCQNGKLNNNLDSSSSEHF